MLQNLTQKLWGRLLAVTLAGLLPACSLFPGLSNKNQASAQLSLNGRLSVSASASGLSPGSLKALNNTTAILQSGNTVALTAVAIGYGVPAALVLGTLAVKAIQNAVARRAAERQRQLEATQLFYAGQCKLDVQPVATGTSDADKLEAQAEQAFGQGDYAKADTLLQKAVAKRQSEKGGEVAYGRVLNRQAALYLATSDFDKAEPPAQHSLEVREKAGGKDSPEVAETLSTLGAIYQQKSDFGKSEAALQRALKIREKALKEDHICVAQTVNQLANLYKEMAAFSKAEPLYQRALTIRQGKLGADSLEVAQTDNDLGDLYLAMGDYAAVEPFYQKALDIRQAKLGPDHPDVAETLNELGTLYRRRGTYPLAEARYRQALDIREKKLPASDPRIAETLGDLASMYESLGDLKSAEPMLRRSLELRQKALGQDSPESAESLAQIALLEQSRGNYDQAETLLKQSLGIREKKLGSQHPSVAESALALGDLALIKQDLKTAADYYQRALTIRQKALGNEHPLVAECLQRQASLARARGDLQAAEPLYTQALSLREKALGNQHPDYAETLIGLATVQVGKGQTADALKNLEKALNIYEVILSGLGGGSDENRIDAFLRTVRSQEDIIYSLLLEKSPSDDVVTLAAKTALLRKGRSVDEAADTSRALYESLGSDDQQKLSALREVRTRRADLALAGSGLYPADVYQKLLKDLQDSEEKQLKDLFDNSPMLRQRLHRPTATEVLTQVQKTLPNDAALLEILAFRQFDFHPTAQKPQLGPGALRYVALVVLPDGKPQAFDLGPGDAIDGAVSDLLSTLTNPESDWQPPAKKLGELVLKPVSAALSGRARLYVAPDGQLNLVPFAVLPTEKGMLIDHLELSYLTSGRDFLRQPPPSKDPPRVNIELIADPEFAVEMKNADAAPTTVRGLFRGLRLGKVAPLPGTREEVKAIEKLLKKAEVKALYGADASKKEFLTIERPGILHVATHGLFLGVTSHGGENARGLTLEDDDSPSAGQGGKPAAARPVAATSTTPITPRNAFGENPLLSSMLVLAGAETASKVAPEKRDPALGNGLVTALEMAGMNLWGTQLVVLSACETGRGDVSNLGQGVYGLRRAVMVAGAETLLTSLWKVDDKATRDLMTKYYQNLLKGGGRGQSMREAALALRKKHPHPYFWAPFIAIGRSAPVTGIGKGSKHATAAAAADDDSDDDASGSKK
jgi:CHAT domain-containing protein